MFFTLNLAFLHMIQDLLPDNFTFLSPNLTKEELSLPLGPTSNVKFRQRATNVSYPLTLMHEPQSLTDLRSSLRARGQAPCNRNPPFLLHPRQIYPMEYHKKGYFLFHLALHVFYFSSAVIVFITTGPQIYSFLKQRKLKTLVTTMALNKLPGTEVLNGSLPLTAPIIPSEGHAKYMCLDPWINALIMMVSLRTVIAYLMVRCRCCTLCRGMEYATACHMYVFVSRYERYSPINCAPPQDCCTTL